MLLQLQHVVVAEQTTAGRNVKKLMVCNHTLPILSSPLSLLTLFGTVLTPEKASFITDRLIPNAVAYLQKVLKVCIVLPLA